MVVGVSALAATNAAERVALPRPVAVATKARFTRVARGDVGGAVAEDVVAVAVVQAAWYADAPSAGSEDAGKVNGINYFWKPFYYKHVETFVGTDGAEELVPLEEQAPCDDAADAPGDAGDEDLHCADGVALRRSVREPSCRATCAAPRRVAPISWKSLGTVTGRASPPELGGRRSARRWQCRRLRRRWATI